MKGGWKGTGNYMHHPPLNCQPPPPLSLFPHLTIPLSPSLFHTFIHLLSNIPLYSSSSPPSCLFYQSLFSPLPCLTPYLSSPPSPLSTSSVASVTSFVAAVPTPPFSPSRLPPSESFLQEGGRGSLLGPRIGGILFHELGLQFQPDGSSVRNIF